jgi:ribulose-phosphate 3-epimerase
MVHVAASILGADLAHLADQVKLVEPDADAIHIDIMDAHFVPPLTFGPAVVRALRPHTTLPLHCHLQVERPASLVGDLAESGADMVAGHVESSEDPADAIRAARDAGLSVGLALAPDTPVERALPYLDDIDHLIVMSVAPGWAGQRFRPETLPRIEALRREIDRRGAPVEIEADGGIDPETARRCVDAGATALAAASAIFGAADPAAAIRRLSATGSVAAARGAMTDAAAGGR